MAAIRAHFDGRVFVPDEPVHFAPGQEATVHVDTDAMTSASADDLAGLGDLAVDTGIRDLATNIDHYLYGHPKVGADDDKS